MSGKELNVPHVSAFASAAAPRRNSLTPIA